MSVKTVSNVVNDFRIVSEATKAKVMAAIEESGYRPNLSARHLKYGRSGFIALAVPELAIPYFAELAAKVDAAARLGYIMLLEITRADRQAERTVLEGVQSRMIDGIIFSPLSLDAEDLQTRDLEMPMVFLEKRPSPTTWIMSPSTRSARRAAMPAPDPASPPDRRDRPTSRRVDRVRPAEGLQGRAPRGGPPRGTGPSSWRTENYSREEGRPRDASTPVPPRASRTRCSVSTT